LFLYTQRINELEEECDKLRDQVQEKQNEVITWQLKCKELEGKIEELEAKCSSSIVKVYWYFIVMLLNCQLKTLHKLCVQTPQYSCHQSPHCYLSYHVKVRNTNYLIRSKRINNTQTYHLLYIPLYKYWNR